VSRKYAKPLLVFSRTSMAGDVGSRQNGTREGVRSPRRMGRRTIVMGACDAKSKDASEAEARWVVVRASNGSDRVPTVPGFADNNPAGTHRN
jgi:hypothetical protein